RASFEESTRSLCPLRELGGVGLFGAVGGERLELAPRRVVVKGLEDQLRELVSQPQRARHGRRSTRVPAMRSCKARLSRRSPAIRYPTPRMADDSALASWRSAAQPSV